jgi:hypothetical protein
MHSALMISTIRAPLLIKEHLAAIPAPTLLIGNRFTKTLLNKLSSRRGDNPITISEIVNSFLQTFFISPTFLAESPQRRVGESIDLSPIVNGFLKKK